MTTWAIELLHFSTLIELPKSAGSLTTVQVKCTISALIFLPKPVHIPVAYSRYKVNDFELIAFSLGIRVGGLQR